MENNITVSVYCLAYNHEKYIEQTLKGFVTQITDFKYEVFVHDDASSDRTADIIRKYAEEYPDIIKPIYQTQNQYSQKIGIAKTYIAPIISGKYLAICEGDDFWCDTSKLQKQVDALEANSDCYMCVHSTKEIYENGAPTGNLFPRFTVKTGAFESKEFLAMCEYYSFHTSSYMIRAEEWKDYMLNPPKFRQVCDVGDEPCLLYFGQLGKVYYISDIMSAYRRGVPSSWTQRNANSLNVGKYLKHPTAMINTFLEYDKYTDKKYHNLLVPRIAAMKVKVAVFTKNAKDLLRKENREYWNVLSTAKKTIVVIAVIFPRTILKMYLRRLAKLNKNKGY